MDTFSRKFKTMVSEPGKEQKNERTKAAVVVIVQLFWLLYLFLFECILTILTLLSIYLSTTLVYSTILSGINR
jgi:hypothetical protein